MSKKTKQMNPFKWLKKKYDLYRFDKAIKRWYNTKSKRLKSIAPTMIERYKWLRKIREEMS